MELSLRITIVDSCSESVARILESLKREPTIECAVGRTLPEEISGETLVLSHVRHLTGGIETNAVVAYVNSPDEYPRLMSIQTMDRLLLTEDTLKCLPELLRAWSQQLAHFNHLQVLSVRERQVMRLLVQGLTNRAAAQRLGLSDRTVEKHRARIMSKMRANSVADLVRIALGCFSISSE